MAVSLPPPGPITLYHNDGRTEEYMPHDLLFQHDKATGIALVTWNTPETLNALQKILLQESLFILEQAKRDDSLKVMIWTGTGKAFSSGATLKPRKNPPKVQWPKQLMAEYMERGMVMHTPPKDFAVKVVTMAFWRCPKISIAAVNGLAVGGAANFALANLHDFVLCSTAAKFKYPFPSLGITPELGSSRMLPYLVGMAKAKELLMLGEWFSPDDALRLNLVNSLHAPEALIPEALALAKKLVSFPSFVNVAASKRLMNGHLINEMDRVMDAENKALDACMKRGMAFAMPKKSKKPSSKL